MKECDHEELGDEGQTFSITFGREKVLDLKKKKNLNIILGSLRLSGEERRGGLG